MEHLSWLPAGGTCTLGIPERSDAVVVTKMDDGSLLCERQVRAAAPPSPRRLKTDLSDARARSLRGFKTTAPKSAAAAAILVAEVGAAVVRHAWSGAKSVGTLTAGAVVVRLGAGVGRGSGAGVGLSAAL